MNKKFILGALFILTIFVSATYINLVSAENPSGSNSVASSPLAATVVINEVYGGGSNAGATYNADFIELYNTGTTPFNLNGYSIQYASATTNSFNQVVVLPADSIPAGGYYLVQTTVAGTTGANLPTPNFTAPTSVNLSGTTGNVIFTNSTVALGATCPASSATTDKMAYGTGTCFETAAAPATTNTTSAQRIPAGTDTDNNSVDFQALVPTPQAGGSGGGTPTPTPTATPTVTPTVTPTPTPGGTPVPGVVINEVYGGGGNAGALYNQDFIELYNSSAAGVDINGYSVQYAAATNVTATGYTACTIATTSTIIAPGSYFLIATGPASTTVGVPLPTVNATCPTTINLSGTAGKVALVNSVTGLNGTTCPPTGATIVDFVGYGTTANCSETAPAPAPADSSSSISRTPIGTDTNNNAADFVSGAPSPTAGGGGPTPTPTPTPTVTPTPTPTPTVTPTPTTARANADFNGDGKTDFTVTRVISGTKNWYTSINGTGVFSGTQFGATADVEIPADFDGDNKADIAVWRPGTTAYFYILQSATNTFRADAFGQTGDDPKVVADYDGDGKADVAVYRTAAGGQNYFYYRASATGNFSATPWGGGTTTRPNVGDYDGDGKADFCVQYDSGNGSGTFAILKSSGGMEFTPFGLISDKLAPGDYDGDGKADFTVVRAINGNYVWYTLTRTGVFSGATFGFSTDIIVPGDYDGDRKQDLAVWRPSATSAPSAFYARRSSDGGLQSLGFGAGTDIPVAGWYVH